MTLRELIGEGAPEVEIAGLAYDSRSVAPGTLFFCVPGFKVDGHDFAPDAVARGAAALVVPAPARPGRARGGGRRRARRDGRRRRPLPRRPDADADAWPGSPARTARPPPPSSCARSSSARASRPACSAPSPRSSAARGAGRAHDARGDRPAGHVRADARRGRRRVRDGGLLARARAAPRRRHPLRGARLHEPDAGPPRLPSDDGRLLRRQAACCSSGAGGPRSSTPTTSTGAGSRDELPDALTFGIDRDADYRATDVEFDTAGSSFTLRDARRRGAR